MRNHQITDGETDREWHLWDFPCNALQVLLTHGIGEVTLRSCVQHYMCDTCAARLDDLNELIALAHRACHSRNPLSERLDTQFRVRFRHQATWTRRASYFTIARRVSSAKCTRFELLGILWALLTDTSRVKRRFGIDLVRTLTVERPQEDVTHHSNVVPWKGPSGGTVWHPEFPPLN